MTARQILWQIGAVGALIALILAAIRYLPLSASPERIVPSDLAVSQLELEAGDSLTQRAIAPAGRYGGVILFSPAGKLAGQHIRVTITNKDRQWEVAGSYLQTDYAVARDLLQLRIATPDFYLQQAEQLYIQISFVSGSPLSLLVSSGEEDIYATGELVINNEMTQQDLPLSLVRQDYLSRSARQGVLAGIIFMLGAAVISALPTAKQRWAAAILLIIIITPVALAGYWFSPDVLGISDWDYYFSLHHAYRETIVKYHQFPLWNPYTCGGTAALGDPEFPVLTPTFLLELIFGIPVGLRLAIYLSTIVGAMGLLALGKRLGLSPLPALLVALAGAFGTVNLLEITEGHVNVLAAMWIPWIFWSWLGVYRGRTRPIVCGAFLAITFLQGGIYLLMYTALAFLVLPWLVGRPKQAILTTVRAGLWALGLAAVKIVPVLLWLKQFPDEAYAGSAYTLPWLGEILFGRYLHGRYVIFQQNSGWHEYGAYVGYFVLGLALLGLTYRKNKRLVRSLMIAVLLTILVSSAGPFLKPLFDKLWFFPRSNISRLILFTVIPLSVLAGLGLEEIRRRLPGGKIFAVLLIGFVAIDIFSLSYPLSEQAFILPEVYPAVEAPPPPIAFTTDRYDPRGNDERTTRSYAAAKQGWGTLTYCSVLGPDPLVRTIYDEGNTGIIQTDDPNMRVENLQWSPNYVEARITASQPARISLNNNYAKGWQVNGEPAQIIDGRIGTKLDAGTYQLTWQYRPPGLVAGVLMTLVTIALALGLKYRRRLRGR